MTPQELIAKHKAEKEAERQRLAMVDAGTETTENLEAASITLEKVEDADKLMATAIAPLPDEPLSALDISRVERWEVYDAARNKVVLTTDAGFDAARLYGERLAEREANPAASVYSFDQKKNNMRVIRYKTDGGFQEVHIRRV